MLPANRLRRYSPRVAMMIVACAVVTAAATFFIGEVPAAVGAPSADTAPTLVLSGIRFSVPAGGGFAATLQLNGVDLPTAAFNPPVPATTPDTTANPAPDVAFPTSYLVTATLYEPIATVAELDRFEVETARAIDVVTVPFHTVAAPNDGGATIDLTFDGSGQVRPLRPSGPGLYPIRLAVIRDGEPLAFIDTFFEQLTENPAARGPLTARIVARLSDIGPLPDQETRDSALARTQRLTRLANTIDQPISVFVAPSVVDFLREQHPDALTKLVAALANETVIALPATYIPADTALANDLTDSFTSSLERGRATVAATFPKSRIDTAISVLDAGSTPDGLALWADNGVTAGLVPSATYAAADNPGQNFDTTVLLTSEVAGDRTLPVAAVSARMGALNGPLDANESPTSRAVGLLAFVAAARAQGAPDLRTLVLATPSIGVPNPDIVAAVVAASNDPSMEWGTLSDLTTSTNSLFDDGRPVSIGWEASDNIDLTTRAEQVHASRLIVADGLSMLPPDDGRRTRWPTTLDNSLSTLIDDGAALAMVDGVNAEVGGLKAAVSPPEPFKFTLTGSDSTLRFQLTNNADTPLTVVITVTSDRLSAPSETTVDLAPNAVNEVAVDVITRSNGTANLRVAVLTPAGNPVGEPVAMTGRVNTYSGLGQLFSVGALLVLTTWWVTHIRRRRRPDDHDDNEDREDHNEDRQDHNEDRQDRADEADSDQASEPDRTG